MKNTSWTDISTIVDKLEELEKSIEEMLEREPTDREWGQMQKAVAEASIAALDLSMEIAKEIMANDVEVSTFANHRVQ